MPTNKGSERPAEIVQQINQAVLEVLVALQEASKAAADITTKLNDIPAMTTTDGWVRTWGESLSKTEAAKMLGVSLTYLKKLVREGDLPLAPDGRVLVRGAAEWAQSGTAVKKAKHEWRVKA